MREAKDARLQALLVEMLDTNQDLTARNVVKASGGLFRHASDLTRNPDRRALLSAYQEQQQRLRQVATKIAKTSKSDLANRLSAAEQEIARLRSQRELLVVAVRAVIHAVGEQGGMRAWRNFFPAYSGAFRDLVALGAVPAAPVLPTLRSDSNAEDGVTRP